MECYVSYASGKCEALTKPPSLEEAQAIVGGWVEAVYPRITPSVVMLVDEEGQLKSKALNVHGCQLYGGPIVGDIIVMSRDIAKKGGWL